MERTTINYQSPTPETLKRAEQWVKTYADPAHPIIVEYVMSDEAYERMMNANTRKEHAEGLDK